MLEYLEIENAGPADHLRLDLAPRLNLLTGDNGLGKSFLLDTAWWVFSGLWPSESHPEIVSGHPIKPIKKLTSTIRAKYQDFDHLWNFEPSEQKWKISKYKYDVKDVIIYYMSDGTACIFDPRKHIDDNEAFVLPNDNIWNGLSYKKRSICNGLINDWSSWKKENNENFKILSEILGIVSPDKNNEKISPGKLTRVYINDARDIPTINFSGRETPVIHTSSGIRRILSIVYILIWTWSEHVRISELLDLPVSKGITLLVDELDAHLHPKWQRTIVKSLMEVMEVLAPEVKVQLIAATHSPLVMASVEPFFDPEQDAWFDLDLNQQTGQVEMTKRPWYRHGDADAWLKSEAFDQKSGYAPETEQVLEEATQAIGNAETTREQADAIDQKLRRLLGDIDPFWISWRYFYEDRGWSR